MHNPLLYRGRKFDIRCFVLVTHTPARKVKRRQRDGGARLTAYLFDEGYLRTSSERWTLDKKDLAKSSMHLTNDGIQCKSDELYGKFEAGNKLSYADFDKYVALNYPMHANFSQEILLPQNYEACPNDNGCNICKDIG